MLLWCFHQGRLNQAGIYLFNSFICSANQWAGFYMIGTSVMKELEGNIETPDLCVKYVHS